MDKCPTVELGVQDTHLRGKKKKIQSISFSSKSFKRARKVCIHSKEHKQNQTFDIVITIITIHHSFATHSHLYLTCFLSVFPPGGSHQRVKLVCVLPFPDGDARNDTEIYSGSGKRRPYVQRGESLYYLAPKCLYMLTPFLDTCTGTSRVQIGRRSNGNQTTEELPMKRRVNMTKSRGGDVFLPMINIGACQWP